jgi:hypothetical protein
MWNKAAYGNPLVRDVARILVQRLPSSWTVSVGARSEAGTGSDAVLDLLAPDGERAAILVAARTALEPRDVPRIAAQRSGYVGASTDARHTALLVVAPYVSPRTQELLAAAGIGYADPTGNLRLTLERPALFIERMGATSNPQPDMRPLHSLKGPTAGRVVRALCDFRPPYGIRELAERSGTPIASVSRVVALLDREALLTREPRGPVRAVDWAGLIRRWAQDYAFTASNRVTTLLAPRGIPALLGTLPAAALRYAVTGSLAAAARAPIAAPRLATVYVGDALTAAATLGLRPTEAGANVLLAEPFDPVVFERCWQDDGVTYAALSQVAADLLTSPGRAPAEGEELLRWMGEHEAAWR